MSQELQSTISLNGTIRGSLLPRKREEMLRDLYLEPGTEVEGSVYCRTLRLGGPVRIGGSVMVKKEIQLDGPAFARNPGKVIFEGDVTAGAMVDLTNRSTQNAAPKPGDYELIIRGNVISDTVALTNAIVTGNVTARDVFLTRSLVFGLTSAQDRAVFTDSTLTSFRAGSEVAFRGNCALWVPYGTCARSNLNIDKDSRIRFLLLCGAPCGCGQMQLFCRAADTCQCDKPVFASAADLVLDGHLEEADTGQEYELNFLTLAPRLFGLTSIDRSLKSALELLEIIQRYRCYTEKFRERFLQEMLPRRAEVDAALLHEALGISLPPGVRTLPQLLADETWTEPIETVPTDESPRSDSTSPGDSATEVPGI